MQWLSLLVSFLLGKFNSSRPPSLKETAREILEEVAYKSRKPAALLLAGVIGILILCGGFFMSVLELTTQYDREGIVRFTATLGAGLFLVVVPLGALIWGFTAAWPGAKAHAKAEQAREEEQELPRVPASSLEQALATLVLDFVKEREFKREIKREHAHAPVVPRESHESESPRFFQ
ncbi:hypothetical protein [Bdellovibrio sp. HCB337]|uniref:hypothetical protein n=1 Tax=Bdellovibrio sp. HCB337 TaxID=3394358 RepID=UPI0039A5DC99